MQARSTLFDVALLDGGRRIARADILAQNQLVSTVEVSAGTVRASRSGMVRRSCSVTIADPSLAPNKATDLLAPYGSEIRLWSGVVRPDGQEELVCVGTFVIWEVDTSRPAGGVTVTGYDRMQLVQQARFLYPRAFPDGTIGGRMGALLTEAVPWAGPLAVNVPDYSTYIVAYEESRIDAVRDMARALGGEVYSDVYGGFVVNPIPDPDGPVAWTLRASQALSGARRRLSRENVYNAVVARSSGTSASVAPIVAVATDDNPYSPTYAGGVSQLTGRAFGVSPMYYTSPLIVDDTQAVQTARAMLRDATGLQRSVTASAIMQPALEPGDVIGLDMGDGVVEQHIAESFTIDLAASSGMSIDTRTTTYQLA